jgi:predicted RNA-binding protein (virulence factor B family)
MEIGKVNKLRVVKEVAHGIYLDGGEYGEILMPKRYVPAGTKAEDVLDAFVYLDSEDRIIATTEKPYAMVGEFACLKVVSVTGIGAFLDWGLMKDLLVPFSEQNKKMEVGRSYVVYIYLDDETNRIVASAKVEDFLDNDPPDYTVSQQVDLMIFAQTDLGYKAIINNNHTGVLYKNEVFKKLHIGDKLKGYVKKLRENGKIDLHLEKAGFGKVVDIATQILDKIKESGGYLSMSDKSPAEEIYNTFGVSKKTFKQAIGGLYKARLISIEGDGIRLTTKK